MNLLEKDLKLLLDTLADRCTTETMRSVMDTMKQSILIVFSCVKQKQFNILGS